MYKKGSHITIIIDPPVTTFSPCLTKFDLQYPNRTSISGPLAPVKGDSGKIIATKPRGRFKVLIERTGWLLTIMDGNHIALSDSAVAIDVRKNFLPPPDGQNSWIEFWQTEDSKLFCWYEYDSQERYALQKEEECSCCGGRPCFDPNPGSQGIYYDFEKGKLIGTELCEPGGEKFLYGKDLSPIIKDDDHLILYLQQENEQLKRELVSWKNDHQEIY